MSARHVHAVMAAGLANPHLIERWQQEPTLLREYGLSPADIDLPALWKFAGLAVKVRHNGLRGDLPWTFRLLNVLGLEADIFASYGSFLAKTGTSLGNSSEARAHDLCAFLEGWLDGENPGHCLLWDLIRHELALMQLCKTSTPDPFLQTLAPLDQGSPCAATVPRICGTIVLHAMRCDPQTVIAALRHVSPPLHTLPREPVHLCYWRQASTSDIQILHVDELGFYLLSCSDGSVSAADLSRRLVGGRRVAPNLLNGLAQLREAGILSFHNKAKKTAR